MRRYVIRRLLLVVPTLVGATMLIFLIMRVVPGDVVDSITGEAGTTEERREQLREELGLKDNLAVQYVRWLGDLLTLDPGTSIVNGQSIIEEVRPRILVTLELGIGAIIVSLLIAIPVGTISAIKQDTWIDYILRVVSIGGLSLPSFWIGTLVVLILSKYFGWLPPLQYSDPWDDPWVNLRQMTWPVLIIGYAFSASVSRMTRSSVLEVLREDYVRTARAKGLGAVSITQRHILRNALIPVVTLSATQFGHLIAGSIVIESIFSLPGMGAYTVQSLSQRDYPAVQFTVALMALVFVSINLLTDLSYGWLDPRVRYE